MRRCAWPLDGVRCSLGCVFTPIACAAGSTGVVWPGFNTSTDGYSCRRQYHAMVNLLDGVVAGITDALVSKAMWEHTLMVFSSVSG